MKSEKRTLVYIDVLIYDREINRILATSGGALNTPRASGLQVITMEKAL